MPLDLATLEALFLTAMGGWLIVLGGAFLLSQRTVDRASAILLALAGVYAILWQQPTLLGVGEELHVAIAQPVFVLLLAGAIFLWTYWLFERHVERLEESLTDLEQSLSMERTLVDVLGHDLRNPLTAAQIDLERVARDSPKLSDRLTEARRELDRALDVMSDGLAYSRLSTQADDESWNEAERLDLADLVRSAVESAHRRAQVRDIELEAHADEEVGIQAHPLFERAVHNLVDNALKNSPPGGRVQATATLDGDEAVLRVADQGPGFGDDHEEIQARFRQGSPDRPGEGLGLAIVRRLVDLHEGSLEIREAPGGGGEVEVRIPRGPAGSSRRPDRVAPHSGSTRAGGARP